MKPKKFFYSVISKKKTCDFEGGDQFKTRQGRPRLITDSAPSSFTTLSNRETNHLFSKIAVNVEPVKLFYFCFFMQFWCSLRFRISQKNCNLVNFMTKSTISNCYGMASLLRFFTWPLPPFWKSLHLIIPVKDSPPYLDIPPQALKTFDSKTPERWEKISEAVPGRSKKDCMKRYKELAEIVKAKKAAALAAAKKS